MQVAARLARNGDAPCFRRMLLLPVASVLLDEAAPVLFDQPDYLTHFHRSHPSNSMAYTTVD